MVTTIAELILPATDTPGAKAARVNEFIDLLLTDWFDESDRERFVNGLEGLEAESRGSFDRPFLELGASEARALLQPLDSEAVEMRVAALRSGSRNVAGLPFFGMMKEMTLVGYYTSEIGATQELAYDAVSGSFAGCVPFDEIGRTWA